MKCSPSRVLFVIGSEGACFGLLVKLEKFIPAACGIEKKVKLVAHRLQKVIVAPLKVRQGNEDEVPFGVQRAKAFVVSISILLVGEGATSLGHCFGAADADEFRSARG